MSLKFLLMLFSMLFFSDNGGGSADGDDDGNDDSDTPPNGSNESGAASDDTTGDGDNDDAGLKSALEKERKDRRDAVKAQKDLQRQLDELNGKTQTDAEKLSAANERATTAEQRLRDATGRTAVYDAAGKLSAISPRAVYASVRDDLDYDDDSGEPTNVDAVLRQLQKDEPDLFRSTTGSNDGGRKGEGSGTGKVDMNSALREMAGKPPA